MKKALTVFFTSIVLMIIVCSCSIKSPEDYYSSTQNTKITETVTVKIDCITALSLLPDELAGYIPDDGIIADTKVEYEENDTAFTVLTKAVKKNKIQLEYSGEGESAYVEGISHLYEFSCGELSGWMFSVNGVFGETGANSTAVEADDVVEWRYTCDLGADIGNTYFGE